nr:MAG TPA: hypothetical protein [Caudoviricetes sp.]
MKTGRAEYVHIHFKLIHYELALYRCTLTSDD